MAGITSPPHIHIRPVKGWSKLHLSELWIYRDVLLMLASRDIKLRYKQTALGIVWVVLQPLLSGAIFALIFGNFAKLPSGGQPYLLYVFSGLMAWNLFSGILQRAGNSLVNDSKLITKVYFPRLLVPCAAAAAVLLDFVVSMLVMITLMIGYQVQPTLWLGLLPWVVVVTITLAIGISFWVSALNVRYRDFMYILPFLIQLWMYASPVVYGMELIPEAWRGLFALNPLTGILEGMRTALLGAQHFSWFSFIAASISSLFALFSGAMFFRRVERGFADSL